MTSGSTGQTNGSLQANWLRRIWERMAAIYGPLWANTMGVSPNRTDESGRPLDGLTMAGQTWAAGLVGLSGEELARGLQACITRPGAFPPVLGEFRALCLAIPSLVNVREDLLREDTKRAPFTLLVGRLLDGWAYRQADARTADRMLREAYDEARERVMRGEPLPQPLPELEKSDATFTPASPEAVARYMAELRRDLGLETEAAP